MSTILVTDTQFDISNFRVEVVKDYHTRIFSIHLLDLTHRRIHFNSTVITVVGFNNFIGLVIYTLCLFINYVFTGYLQLTMILRD